MLFPAWHCIAWIWLGELPTFPTSLNLPTNLSSNYLSLWSASPSRTFCLYSIFIAILLLQTWLSCLCSIYCEILSCLSSLSFFHLLSLFLPFFILLFFVHGYDIYITFHCNGNIDRFSIVPCTRKRKTLRTLFFSFLCFFDAWVYIRYGVVGVEYCSCY